MDIIVCRIKYPNDPTNNTQPHQHFVGTFDSNSLVLYSISSINGKFDRVFDKNGDVKEDIYVIGGDMYKKCKLKVPSFIDCGKSYRLNLDSSFDVSRLSNRTIPQRVVDGINKNIDKLKKSGKHTEYFIDEMEFKNLNYKCVIN